MFLFLATVSLCVFRVFIYLQVAFQIPMQNINQMTEQDRERWEGGWKAFGCHNKNLLKVGMPPLDSTA